MGFYSVAHQTHAPPAPSAAPTLIILAAPQLALRLGPKDRIFRASAAPPRRRPAMEGQSQARRRRRRLPPTFCRQSPCALACVLRAPADDPAYAPPSPLPPLLFPWEPGQLPRVAGPWLRRCTSRCYNGGLSDAST